MNITNNKKHKNKVIKNKTFVFIGRNGKHIELPVIEFEEAVDNVLKGKYDTQNNVLLSTNTPKIILENVEEAVDKPILINISHIKKAIFDSERGGHLLDKDRVKVLPKYIENPFAIVYNEKYGSYNLFLMIPDITNQKVITSMKLNDKGNYYNATIQANRMSTVFGMFDNESYINKYVKEKNIVFPKGTTKKELIYLANTEYPYPEDFKFNSIVSNRKEKSNTD